MDERLRRLVAGGQQHHAARHEEHPPEEHRWCGQLAAALRDAVEATVRREAVAQLRQPVFDGEAPLPVQQAAGRGVAAEELALGPRGEEPADEALDARQ
jgi:hypothetical protein